MGEHVARAMRAVARAARAAGLTVVNEARLLFRDPVSLLMLLIAPVVIMTVAGYSLGALYGVHGRAIDRPDRRSRRRARRRARLA